MKEPIIQNLKVTNWMRYESVEEIGDCEGMDVETVKTIMGNKPVEITTFINSNGEGWEIRKYLDYID